MLKDHYDTYLSIGYVCTISTYLFTSSDHSYRSHIFDRIATPMWAVQELLENGFDDFFNHDNMKYLQLFDKSDKKFWIDTKYGIRMLGKDLEYDSKKKLYDRYIQNFMTKLNNAHSLLFIRQDEPMEYADMGKRLLCYPDKLDEYKALLKFSHWVETVYPQLDFHILWLTDQKDVENTRYIHIIPNVECDYRNPRMGSIVNQHLVHHGINLFKRGV